MSKGPKPFSRNVGNIEYVALQVSKHPQIQQEQGEFAASDE
jgi:hypothetical protein